jgi:hypothetical protein
MPSLPPCVTDMLTALAVAAFTGAWALLATLTSSPQLKQEESSF